MIDAWIVASYPQARIFGYGRKPPCFLGWRIRLIPWGWASLCGVSARGQGTVHPVFPLIGMKAKRRQNRRWVRSCLVRSHANGHCRRPFASCLEAGGFRVSRWELFYASWIPETDKGGWSATSSFGLWCRRPEPPAYRFLRRWRTVGVHPEEKQVHNAYCDEKNREKCKTNDADFDKLYQKTQECIVSQKECLTEVYKNEILKEIERERQAKWTILQWN